MAKFSKAQYLMITQAIGEALADVTPCDSKIMENVVFRVANKIATVFEDDNSSFNRKQFIEGIYSVAELDAMCKDVLKIH